MPSPLHEVDSVFLQLRGPHSAQDLLVREYCGVRPRCDRGGDCRRHAEAFAGDNDIVTIAFFYPQFVIALKRGHDLDMSSRVIYAWYIALVVDYGVIRLAAWLWRNFDQNIYSLVGLAFVLVFITVVGLVTIVMMIELGFRRGTRGPNKYGPDPLAKT
jgi:uncharacterized membrane protein YhaH (DUF805 family)